jgi:hypothetical protein
VPDRQNVDSVRFSAVEKPVGEIEECDHAYAGPLRDFWRAERKSAMRRSIAVKRCSKAARD